MKKTSLLILMTIFTIGASIFEIKVIDYPILNFLLPMLSGVFFTITCTRIIGFKAHDQYRELMDKQAADRQLDDFKF